jgi:SAM-dependent methyltransferase
MKIDFRKEWNKEGKKIKKNKEFRYDITSPHYSKLSPIENLVLKLVNKKKKVLDAGCGMGRMMRIYPNSYGVDVSEEMLDLNPFKKRIRRADLTKDDLGNNNFDAVFLFRVVLHLRGEVIDDVLLRCNKALRKDGVIILDTTKGSWNFHEMVWKLKRFYWWLTGGLSPISAKVITMRDMIKILDRLGFSYEMFHVKEVAVRSAKEGEHKPDIVIFKIKKLE